MYCSLKNWKRWYILHYMFFTMTEKKKSLITWLFLSSRWWWRHLLPSLRILHCSHWLSHMPVVDLALILYQCSCLWFLVHPAGLPQWPKFFPSLEGQSGWKLKRKMKSVVCCGTSGNRSLSKSLPDLGPVLLLSVSQTQWWFLSGNIGTNSGWYYIVACTWASAA